MVRSDWFDIAMFLKKKGFLLTIFTNATLIDENIALKLSSLKAERIEISLYGFDKTSYDTVTRIPGSFRKFEKALKLLKEYNVNAILKPVVLKQNVDGYSQMLSFAQNMGYDLRFEFSPYLISGQDSKGCLEYRLSDEDMIKLLMNEDFVETPVEELCLCAIGTRGFVIGPNGDVRSCVAHPEIAGNIRYKSLKDIWHTSHTLLELRALAKNDFEQCAACDLIAYCRPCIAMNVLECGQATNPSPENCRIARNRKIALHSKKMA
jgi:radical SAM protein with 4Fe4S-binding SPASM domain